MALILLASTVSWTVGKHYCMGRLMNIALFEHAEDCGMEAAYGLMEDIAVENHCCKDESVTIQGQDDLKLSFNDLDVGQQSFLVAFTHSYIDLFVNWEERLVPQELYPPPLLVKDIQLLDNVFLI